MQLSYCGANYHGWQRQPHDISVQETIEQRLAIVLQQPVPLTGAGRTDTGVNAAMMIAHFDLSDELTDDRQLVRALNALLPGDIAIQRIYRVDDEAHARFDAKERTYKYFAHTAHSAFLDRLSWRCSPRLDFDLMNSAAEKLLDYSDFTSFSKSHTDAKTNICNITHAQWTPVSTDLAIPEFTGERWVFTISADRFLRNMVRAIVGTLVEVGNHKMSVGRFCEVIEQKSRQAAGISMPGHALYLWNVVY